LWNSAKPKQQGERQEEEKSAKSTLRTLLVFYLFFFCLNAVIHLDPGEKGSLCHLTQWNQFFLPPFLFLQAQRDIIFELRRIAFDAESEPNNSSGSVEKRKSMYTRDYKKLGFIVSKLSPSNLPGLTSAASSVWPSCALQNSFHISRCLAGLNRIT
jgi:hypothetical protein